MILDNLLQFNDGTTVASLSVVTTSVDSAILDFTTASFNPGSGTPVWVISTIGLTFTSGSSMNVELRSGAASTTVTLSHFVGKTYTAAECTKGKYLLAIPLPADQAMGRFVKLVYHTTGSAFLLGTIDSYLTLHAPNKLY